MPPTNFDQRTAELLIHRFEPTGDWQIVDVHFPAAANTNYQIRHTLTPPSPEQVEYSVLRQSTAGTIYEDRTPGRQKWGQGFIVLRSDTANWKGRLLLRVLKSPLPPLEG